ncbi:vWA domain-containing protein [Lichenibacterium dinghuense]|uniref:vWA domain-containing protein n=1 Tax=Lichenibacterium dinghuense TaxID=2895977 RepID=UPI001F40D02B|nr:VWA domain-containing protein [Lichenibacterium sp. 6Y81]
MTAASAAADGPGRLPENILYFARALRDAGLPVGPGAVLDAVEAARTASFTAREDFRAVLRAVMVKRREHAVLFDGVFDVFWRRRGFLDQLMGAMSPKAPPKSPVRPKAEAGATRVADALFRRAPTAAEPQPSLDLDARFTVSAAEVLRTRDFAQMGAAEVAAALAAIRALRLPADARRIRRLAGDPRGSRVDPRRSFRRSLRAGGGAIDLARRERVEEPPPVVAICDISGSMADYTRVFLHFLHALSAQRRVASFLFGTRLTNVTRALTHRDVDEALAAASAAVPDWSGGTRIGASLRLFNRHWLRRVGAGSATVLLFTDGLERDGLPELEAEMRRLQRSCRRLVWLNPLLRFDGFAAQASGIRTMLPLVDEFRPIHNLKAVAELCTALDRGGPGGDPRAWLARGPGEGPRPHGPVRPAPAR